MRRYGSKPTTDEFLQLDVRLLRRRGWLRPASVTPLVWSESGTLMGDIGVHAEEGAIALTYNYRWRGEEWNRAEYRVEIECTRCHFGGARPWFRCPNPLCGRRVAILYCSGVFACRHCYHIVYDSQCEPAYLRALHRAQAIRVRLGGTPNMGAPFPAKPKGLHWRTYHRLFVRAEHLSRRSWPRWATELMRR